MNRLFLAVALVVTACGSKFEEEKAACEQAITCLETVGQMTNTFRVTYGPDGACWENQEQATVCEAFCLDAIDSYSSLEACGGSEAFTDDTDAGDTDSWDDTDWW